MKLVFFSASGNGENGLGDEGADGAVPPARSFGLEPPWLQHTAVKYLSFINR